MILRWLLSNWLHEEVAKRARGATDGHQQASQAAPDGDGTQQAAAGESAEEQEAKSLLCDVAVILALGIEAGALIGRLAEVRSYQGKGVTVHVGHLGDRRVAVVQSGPGREAAARATGAVLAGHRPAWVISAGFAGGLDNAVRRDHIVVADSVTTESGERLAIDMKMPPGERLHIGRILTIDRIVHRPEEKQRLGRDHQALAVDMETYGVTQACRDGHARCVAVRIVSDAVDDELPRELENLMKQKSIGGKMGAVVGSLFRRPASIKDMWQLKERALLASDVLAKFLEGMIAQLPPHSKHE